MSKGRRMSLGGTLGVAIFLAVVLGVPGKRALAAPGHGGQGLMAVPAALASAVAKNEARTSAHAAAYQINAQGCAGAEQSLRACFDPGAAARFAGAKTALHLRFSAWGRSGALAPVHLQAGRAQGNRIAYRGAGIEAWWRALPIGYEQGFTVTHAPAGAGKLVLEFKASAPAKVQAGVLSWGAVHYGKLYVTDAAGHRLPARLSAHGRTVLISIADAHARYPLNIDPLVWIGQRVSDGQNVQFFGDGVDVKGTTALIGSTAGGFVYNESSNGVWTQGPQLIPSGPGAAGYPGTSWALNAAGTVAVVGDSTAPVGFDYAAGRAWVFTKSSNGTWTQTAALTSNPPVFFAWFGTAVAINAAGTEIAVGAPFAYGFYGRAYVFTESNGTWTQTQEFAPPASVGRGGFGVSLTLDGSGSTLLVGCPGATINGVYSQGAAFAYTYAGGSWSSGTMLTADNGQYYDQFGLVRLDAAGTTALIAAPDATVPGHNIGTGAAYIFTNSGGTWTQGQEIAPSDGVQGASFGQGGSLAISADGKTVLMGAPHQNGSTVINKNGIPLHQFAGAAYVFKDINGTWTQTSELDVGSRPQDKYGLFGDSVAMSGNMMLIGAGSYNPLTSQRYGSAYFYSQPPLDLSLVLNAPAQVNASAQYTSQAILTNSSASASAALTAIMPLPAGVGYVSASPTQGSCSETSAAVTCALGSVAGNGGMASVTLTLTAPSTGGTIKNQVMLADVSPAMNVVQDTAVGGPPGVSGLTNLQLQPSQSGTETFSVEGTGPLTVTAHSSNQTLLPDANITGASSCNAANVCTLGIDPVAQQSGSATVTIAVTDNTGAVATGSFTVAVAAPPAPPSGGGGGGGGALGGLALAALLGLALAGAWSRRRG